MERNKTRTSSNSSKTSTKPVSCRQRKRNKVGRRMSSVLIDEISDHEGRKEGKEGKKGKELG